MVSEEVKSLCQRIGQFYIEKNKGDRIAAEKELNRIHFTAITILDTETVEIKAMFVGLFIGKHGQNLDKLGAFLGKKIKCIEDRDSPYHWFIQDEYDYSDMYNYEEEYI